MDLPEPGTRPNRPEVPLPRGLEPVRLQGSGTQGPGEQGGDEADSSQAGTEARLRRLDPGVGDAPVEESGFDLEAQRELVERVVAGDQQAAADLVDQFQGRVFRMVRHMWSKERELAEDLTQEVFLRVFRGLPRFQHDCSLGAWVHRITVNVCISEIRKRRALKRDRPTLSLNAPRFGDEDDGGIDPVAEQRSAEEAVERDELYARCRGAIDDLPELWRVILTLRDLEGRSYEEIAEILELPIGTVRSRLHRARARVRKRLEQHGEGGDHD